MRVLLSVQGKSWNDMMDPRFGRAKNFLLYDEEKDELVHVVNQYANVDHGAGIQAGQIASQQKADVVISGAYGPKAFQTLNAGGIKLFAFQGDITAKDAYLAFKNNQLKEVLAPK